MVMFFASLDLGSCCGRAKPFNVDWRVIGYYWCFDSFISLFLFYFSSFQIISLLIWDGNAMIPRRKGEEGQDGAMAEVLNDETGERREKTMSCSSSSLV